MMDSAESNPYKAPESELADNQLPSSLFRPRLMLVGWVCSVTVAAYGLFGVVANGLDLVRTRSSRDLGTELRLFVLLGFGCFLCWLTYSVQKRKRSNRSGLILALALAASGVGYVLYDFLTVTR